MFQIFQLEDLRNNNIGKIMIGLVHEKAFDKLLEKQNEDLDKEDQLLDDSDEDNEFTENVTDDTIE